MLDPASDYALLLTLGDAVEGLHGAMRQLSDTHRMVLSIVAKEISS